MARDYKKERKYDGKPEVKRKRAARNRARRKMINAGKASVGDNRDVMHKDGNALNNKTSNLKVGSRRANRSYPRTKTARKKNPRD